MMVAAYTVNPSFNVESRQSLFDRSPYNIDVSWRGYDVTRDDERFVMIRLPGSAETEDSRLILVTNCFEELERLVPI